MVWLEKFQNVAKEEEFPASLASSTCQQGAIKISFLLSIQIIHLLAFSFLHFN